MELPRLKVTHKYGYYNTELMRYEPRERVVEVLALNLSTGKMHVRTVEKVKVFADDQAPEIQDFHTDIAPFFEHYRIERTYDYI